MSEEKSEPVPSLPSHTDVKTRKGNVNFFCDYYTLFFFFQITQNIYKKTNK